MRCDQVKLVCGRVLLDRPSGFQESPLKLLHFLKTTGQFVSQYIEPHKQLYMSHQEVFADFCNKLMNVEPVKVLRIALDE